MKNNQTKTNVELAKVSRQIATEGLVLLENKQQTLPLQANETLSLFGRCQIDTYRSGTGSGGAVNVPYAINALEGLRANDKITLNEDLVAVYQQWVEQNPFDNGGGGWAAEPWFQKEMPLTPELVQSAAQNSNKAMVFIGRTAGEEQDNAQEKGSYFLTDLEVAMIETVNAHFDKVIIVLNVSNVIDMSWLETISNKQSITAVLYSWAAGMEGGHALADIVSGDVTPSGRLTDTIAHKIEDYPSSANFGRTDFNVYQEDIYLGYRYFETFCPNTVKYEFGSGLSYTQFSRALANYQVEGQGAEQVLHFDIEVTNTGDQYSGKDVVQLYVEAPQGELGKPARVLAGFNKSRTLAPNESEVVRVSVPLNRLASYDDGGVTGNRSAYVVEAGDYHFYVGGSVRLAERVDARFSVAETLCLEQLAEAMAPIKAFTRIKPGALNDDQTYQIEYEPVPTRVIDLAQRIKANLPEELVMTGDKGIKLIDVKEGKASIEEFIAQLSVDDLACIARGEGMCSPKVTAGTAAAFGGVTDDLLKYGIPIAAAADGPSGIRMDSGHHATQVPIGTLLGCSWNSKLNEELYYLVGQELRLNKIDTLLGPGINIHRHPLNGRNFEYFSEDALLTGIMAAAQTRGLKRAGVTGTIKHFAANDQETARKDVDSVVSERALREIHLKPFEMAVKEGGATTIMTSYNPVNGHWAASNYDLNTTILRNEWGYSGIVMSDWWAQMNDPVFAGKESATFTSFMLRSQNDLYMVVENDGSHCNAASDDTLEGLEKGAVTIGELQRSAANICRFLMDTPAIDRPIVLFNTIKEYQPVGERSDDVKADLNAITFAGDKKRFIEVEEAGIYLCEAQMRYDRDATAQSSCNLSINGEFAMTLPINGTNGRTVAVKGQKVSLSKGTYQLSVEAAMSGLELDFLTLTKQ
jgi:beta-glucosidase